MRIKVSGKQISIGDALPSHAESRIEAVVTKYAERPVEATCVFSKDAHQFVCESSVHLSTGLHSQASGRANDIYDSLDASLERMEKQLRRYKRRLKDHHKNRVTPIEVVEASSYILASASDESDEDEPETLQPIIVAETATQVKSLSVGEAVMQMELAGAPVLVFRNDAHGGVNVVYQREDGNVGWIDLKDVN
jgi:ribosomal subunit interface protein